MTFVVTNQWLMQHQSRGAAWTADQLAAIGIEWPPPRGWKHSVIGMTISAEAKARFESALRSRHACAAANLELFG